MYKHGALALIAAIVMATMALAIPATTVSAAHTTTVTIDKNLVKGSTSVILTITVNNAGPSAIKEVKVVVPSGFTAPRPLVKIPKDNVVQLPSGNVAVLPAGTLVQLDTLENVTVPENTVVIRENGTWVYVPSIGDNVLLTDNAMVKIVNSSVKVELDNGDNVAPGGDVVATLTDNELRLLEPLLAARLTADTVQIQQDLIAEVKNSGVKTGDNLAATDNIYLKVKKTEALSDNVVKTVASVTGLRGGAFEVTIGANVELRLRDNNLVVLLPDTRLVLDTAAAVRVPENTDVKVQESTVLTVVDTSSVENQPINWTQENNDAERSVTWKGIGDNKIAPGSSLSFPFATRTASSSGTYTIYVRTKDESGAVYQTSVTVTVDMTPPTIEKIEISPLWAKANTDVTITVTASEALAKMENVYVVENNGQPVQITMTPSSDNKVWTGTYTTSDNVSLDGVATVYVVGAQYEDLVGNAGSNKTENFYVDRMKPPVPNVQSLFQPSFPTGGITNEGSWLLEGHTQDNYCGTIFSNIENMTVKIRVGNSTYEVRSTAGGYFYRNITLTEGVNEIGVRFVDLAGNEGDENVENITYDATPPSITLVSISGKNYTANMPIADNTPSFVIRISDSVLGVENDDFDETDNSGYVVYLCADDNTPIVKLTPKSVPTEDPFYTFTFENDYPTELADNWYKINVAAGDNLQSENRYFRFRIDVTPPAAPPVSSIWNPLSGTSFTNPMVVVTNTMVLRGEGAEPNATIKIYIKNAATGAVLATETTPTDTNGNWNKTITLPQGGVTIQIEVTCIDEAGLESTPTLWGFVLLDATAPSVTISAPCSAGQTYTTSEVTVVVSGSITKDTWETYNTGAKAVTATIQVGSATPGNVTINSDGTFVVSAALSEGTNTITVRAVDSAGNSSSATITVVRTVTPWATYAIIIVILALILAAIAIFRKK